MAHLLRGVVKVIADREGGPPDHTVATCPANWGDYKRELFDQAVTQADIGPVSVAVEPEAAAVHYASTTRVQPGEVVAVYDLGGGTFDAAVLRNTGEGFELAGRRPGHRAARRRLLRRGRVHLGRRAPGALVLPARPGRPVHGGRRVPPAARVRRG